MKKIHLFFAILGALWGAPVALAESIPLMIHYQGKVEVGGVPHNGPGYFKFSLVDDPTNPTQNYWTHDGSTPPAGEEPTNFVKVPVNLGLFSVKLGDESLTNMKAIPGLVFTTATNTPVYLRIWFSKEETGPFERLIPDRQLASVPYAYRADTADRVPSLSSSGTINSATNPIDWTQLKGVPAEIIDGDQVGITSETDPTVAASVKDGVSWSELSGIPPGFADGVDDTGGGGGPASDVVCSGCVDSTDIANGTITNDDISATAAIASSKLSTDVALLGGRLGGQVLRGGTEAFESLTLDSTANVTKGDVLINPSGGNVGIGTTIPTEKLTLAGNELLRKTGTATASTQFPSYDLKLEASSWDTTGAGSESVNTFTLRNIGLSATGPDYRLGLLNNAGTEVLSVKANGNVGLGTTTPGARLDVAGGAILQGTLDMSTTNKIINLAAPTAASDAATKGYVDSLTGGTPSVQLQATTPGTPQTGHVNLTGTLIAGTFSGSGSGLTSLNATNITTGTLDALRLPPDGYATTYVNVTGDTMTGTLNLPTNGLVAGTNQLVLSGGNVGIGTTLPSSSLHVSGDSRLAGHLAAGLNASMQTYETARIQEDYANLGSVGTYSLRTSQIRTESSPLTVDTTARGIYNSLLCRMTEDIAGGFDAICYGNENVAYTDGTNTFNSLRGASNTAYTTSTATANQDGLAGSLNSGYLNSAGTLTNAYGSYNQASNNLTGTVTNAYGSHNDAYITSAGSGTLTTAEGSRSIAYVSSATGTITSAAGARGRAYTNVDGSIITTARGVYGEAYEGVTHTTGGITTAYGGVFSAQDATTTYGVYAEGLQNSPNTETFTTMYGTFSDCYTNSATVTVTNCYGVRGRVRIAGGGGTITNGYGGYFEATGATNNYGLIVASGNVGIGTTGPTSKLNIVANTDDQGNEGAAHGLVIETGTGDQSIWMGYDGTDDLGYINAAKAGEIRPLGLQTRGGNVGIGTTGPLDKLHVAGDARVGTGTTGCVKDADATVIAGTCSSDARMKRDIEPFPNTLGKLTQLQPVNFNWKAEEFPEYGFGTSESYGLVAQEVERVLPELVTEDGKGFKAVRYSKLPLLLLQAIKELKAENEALKHRLGMLEGNFNRNQGIVSQ